MVLFSKWKSNSFSTVATVLWSRIIHHHRQCSYACTGPPYQKNNNTGQVRQAASDFKNILLLFKMLQTARDEVYIFDKAKSSAGTGIQTVSRKKKGGKKNSVCRFLKGLIRIYRLTQRATNIL